jgi:hypothetical protein
MKRSFPVLVALCFAAGIALWFFLRSDAHDHALTARELATRTLAEYLAQRYPGQHALLVSNPFTENHGATKDILAMEQAGIAGVQKGLGGKVTLKAIAFPELKPEARTNPRAFLIDAETTTPISYLVSPDAFDKLATQHPDCDLLISLVGLPAALHEVQCWRDPRLHFALLLPDLRFVGDAAAVRQAVDSGKLIAFVLNKPGAPDLRSAPKQKTDFAERFLLVTRENIEQVLARYPQLFPAR